MKQPGTGKHCSDECLLGHIDRQLPHFADRRVRSHLKDCWECRQRLAGLESAAGTLVSSLRERDYPDAVRVAEARQTLRERQLEFERRYAGRQPAWWQAVPRPGWRWMGAAACAVAVLLAVVATRSRQKPDAPDAPRLLAEIRAAERKAASQAGVVHQVFDVRITASDRPEAWQRTIETWSGERNSRFSARLAGERATVQYAVWRNPGTGDVRYDPEPAPLEPGRAAAATVLANIRPATARDLERALLDWLRSRDWRPVTLTQELMFYTADSGEELRAERARTDAGEAILRIVVRRREESGVRECVLEVAPGSYRIRKAALRFLLPARTLALAFEVRVSEAVEPSAVQAAVFEPGRALPAAGRTAAPPIAPPRPAEPAPDPVQLELDAMAALHRVGACLGEPVAVSRTARGAVEVRGTVATEERKRELIAALSPLRPLRLAIGTVRDEGTSTPAATPAETAAVAAERTAIEERLERYFSARSRVQAAPGGKEAASEFSNQVIAATDAAMDQAWALRRLADWAAARGEDSLNAELRARLRAMAHDHAKALAGHVGRSCNLLEPFLAEAQEQGPVSAGVRSPAGSAPWQSTAWLAFRDVEEMVQTSLALFARPKAETRDVPRSLDRLRVALSNAKRDGEALEVELRRDAGRAGL